MVEGIVCRGLLDDGCVGEWVVCKVGVLKGSDRWVKGEEGTKWVGVYWMSGLYVGRLLDGGCVNEWAVCKMGVWVGSGRWVNSKGSDSRWVGVYWVCVGVWVSSERWVNEGVIHGGWE